MSEDAVISSLLAKMRQKFLVVCALPTLENMRRMQQDAASEIQAPAIADLSRKLSPANTIRNNIYLKLQRYMRTYKLHDTVTRAELKWIRPSDNEQEALKLYLKGAWLYKYCQKDQHGTVLKGAPKGARFLNPELPPIFQHLFTGARSYFSLHKIDTVSRNIFSFFLTCLYWYLAGNACEINCKLMIPRYEGYLGLMNTINDSEWETLSVFYKGEEQQLEDLRSIPLETEFDIA
jgi:hypothetical protein